MIWRGILLGGAIGCLVGLALGLLIYAAGAQNATPLQAQTFPVPFMPTDGPNIAQLCKFTMDNATLDVRTRTAVGQYCLDLTVRIEKAVGEAREEQAKRVKEQQAPAEGEKK